MPVISLAEVAANSRTIEVDIGLPDADDGAAQTLTVTYRVATLTTADEMTLMRATTMSSDDIAETQEFMFGLTKRLIARWGLTGPLTDAEGKAIVAAGKPVPIEPDILKKLPSSLLGAVLRACLKDSTDPKASPATAS